MNWRTRIYLVDVKIITELLKINTKLVQNVKVCIFLGYHVMV